MKAFVAHSFLPADMDLVTLFEKMLEAFDIIVISGEKPSTEPISDKIKERIESADFFVGIFTRKGKKQSEESYYTSGWVIDEKAYAIAKGKKVILLVEEGVDEIGGIQGDLEYISFNRNNLAPVMVKLAAVLWELSRKALASTVITSDIEPFLTSQKALKVSFSRGHF